MDKKNVVYIYNEILLAIQEFTCSKEDTLFQRPCLKAFNIHPLSIGHVNQQNEEGLKANTGLTSNTSHHELRAHGHSRCRGDIC